MGYLLLILMAYMGIGLMLGRFAKDSYEKQMQTSLLKDIPREVYYAFSAFAWPLLIAFMLGNWLDD